MSLCSIRFFLGEDEIADRLWAHVPRKGDTIMLGPNRTAYEIVEVVWGLGIVAGPGKEPLQRVNILVREEETPKEQQP